MSRKKYTFLQNDAIIISSWRTTLITGEPKESSFLFQQLLTAFQRGNAVAFLNNYDSD